MSYLNTFSYHDQQDEIAEENLYEAYFDTNTCIQDLETLTIIDSLPESEKEGEPCHLSLLSIYATESRTNYEVSI